MILDYTSLQFYCCFASLEMFLLLPVEVLETFVRTLNGSHGGI